MSEKKIFEVNKIHYAGGPAKLCLQDSEGQIMLKLNLTDMLEMMKAKVGDKVVITSSPETLEIIFKLEKKDE